jgi:hypothetical protein
MKTNRNQIAIGNANAFQPRTINKNRLVGIAHPPNGIVLPGWRCTAHRTLAIPKAAIPRITHRNIPKLSLSMATNYLRMPSAAVQIGTHEVGAVPVGEDLCLHPTNWSLLASALS